MLFAPLGDLGSVLLEIGRAFLICALIASFTVIFVAYFVYREDERERRQAERRAFESHVDRELKDRIRVRGGRRVSSDDRWGRAA
jgi:cbb3-type cytochrome oxidase subunit 3